MKTLVYVAAIFALSMSLMAQAQVTRESVPGITNLARLETTVACAGAITPESVVEIKKMGFTSVINLRVATEANANVEAEEAAAKAAGVKYFHIPFVTAAPEPAAVDRFLQVITQPGTEPAFIHCAGGSRAAAMWFVKRAVVDKWTNERAMAEAEQLGLTNAGLKTFVIDYVQKKR